MIRSMYTAISSLAMHQKYLDVVSNNLANANTTGFKTSRVLFQDQFSQTYNSGSAPTTAQGGTNPTQIGLGVMMGYVSPNFNQGMLQSTGRNMDLSIQGDGFFIFGKGTDSTYSRAGSLGLDANGILVNSVSGLPAQGWSLATGQTAVDTTKPIGEIKIDTGRSMAKATEKVVLGGNFSSANIGTITKTITVSMGVYDKLGALRKTSIVFTPPATAPATPPTRWTWEAFDDNGTTPKSVGKGNIDFDANGQYAASTPVSPLGLKISGSAGAGDVPIDIDFTKLTMLSSTTTAAAISQNGVAAGSVTDVYIAPNTGKVSLVFSNGLTSEIGQVAVARFTNPTGLVSSDHTSFLVGVNSGDPEIGTAGTGGRGNIASGYLESSNVDMAQEFTNMILAQRGFQASTKAITTSDEILQELVNLKR